MSTARDVRSHFSWRHVAAMRRPHQLQPSWWLRQIAVERSAGHMAMQYLRLSDGDSFPELDGLSPYKAVVVIEENVSGQWQAKASRWLADSGCRYMMAWGKGCRSWDTSVDLANLEQFGFAEIPDDDFIMTTWHDDEPLPEVFWFAKISAHHPTLELEKVLLLHIGSSDRQSEFERLYRDT